MPAASARVPSRATSSHWPFGSESANDMLVPRAAFAQNSASFSRFAGSSIGLRSRGTGRSSGSSRPEPASPSRSTPTATSFTARRCQPTHYPRHAHGYGALLRGPPPRGRPAGPHRSSRGRAAQAGAPMSETLAGLRRLLHDPGPVHSAILAIPDAGVAGILGHSGFDYVVIDAEHAPFTLESMRGCVDALAASPAASVIRVAANDPVHVKQALDLGADGVQVPTVHDAGGAAAAVSAARYSPEGTRGVGLGHASRYGANAQEYLASANARIAVIAMIESARGVENASEIAATPGLDGVVIGPFDLSADL